MECRDKQSLSNLKNFTSRAAQRSVLDLCSTILINDLKQSELSDDTSRWYEIFKLVRMKADCEETYM